MSMFGHGVRPQILPQYRTRACVTGVKPGNSQMPKPVWPQGFQIMEVGLELNWNSGSPTDLLRHIGKRTVFSSVKWG